ncbi:SDR family oxidoreductase [Streptomyces cavernicola]|uniref:SDR family oxidoreductase n=1 Tax=Streptomyces cavernicola TaxID=3043613 RepID=A0ABT6SAK6_9ACTN|nr:SDR family oxidoreductase [Streptomyces sp. B-S-A6]MDI3405228.1 SDR family oxidoreductase [Streptomyces sp. B-S-A6]
MTTSDRDRRHLTGRRVFITGAGGGIGGATARLAAAQGALLFLTDKDADRLATTAARIRSSGGAVAYAGAVDLTDHEAVRAMAKEIHAESGRPMDVVMNVAGISVWGSVTSLRNRHWRSVVEADLMGPIHVIEEFVPPMVEAGRGGRLVNVSSAAGLLGLPWHAAYSAGKFGLRGVSEVLRFDLRRYGIGVSLVVPGAVDTPLTETVEIVGVDPDDPAISRLRARFRRHAATPEQVAAAILDAVRRNRYLVHTSGLVRFAHGAQRFCPPVYVALMRLLNRRAQHVLEAAARRSRTRTARTERGW